MKVMGSLYIDPHGGVILDISRANLSGFALVVCHTSFDIGRLEGRGGGGGGRGLCDECQQCPKVKNSLLALANALAQVKM